MRREASDVADGVVADFVEEDRGGDGAAGARGGDEALDAAVAVFEFVGDAGHVGAPFANGDFVVVFEVGDELAIDVVGGGFAARRGAGADVGMGTRDLLRGFEQASGFSRHTTLDVPLRRRRNWRLVGKGHASTIGNECRFSKWSFEKILGGARQTFPWAFLRGEEKCSRQWGMFTFWFWEACDGCDSLGNFGVRGCDGGEERAGVSDGGGECRWRKGDARWGRKPLIARKLRLPGKRRWYDDAEALIHDKEVDAVYIATPPGTHEFYAMQVLAAGKPCYVEKPMSRNAAEARRMVEGFAAKGVPLFVAYYRRALPRFLKVKEILESGVLGESLMIVYRYRDGQMAERKEPVPWRLQAEHSGGGLFLDLGSHALDLLDFFFGPLKDFHGNAGRWVKKYDVEDAALVAFETEAEHIGIARWQFASDGNEDIFEIEGPGGLLTVPCFASGPVRVKYADGKEQVFELPWNPGVRGAAVGISDGGGGVVLRAREVSEHGGERVAHADGDGCGARQVLRRARGRILASASRAGRRSLEAAGHDVFAGAGCLDSRLDREEEVLQGDADRCERVERDVDDVVLGEEDVGGGVAVVEDVVHVDDGGVAFGGVGGGVEDVDAFGPAEAGDVGVGEDGDEGVAAGEAFGSGAVDFADDVVVLGTVVDIDADFEVFVFVGKFGGDAVFDFVRSESCDLDAMGGVAYGDGAVGGDLDAGIVDFGGDVGGGTDEEGVRRGDDEAVGAGGAFVGFGEVDELGAFFGGGAVGAAGEASGGADHRQGEEGLDGVGAEGGARVGHESPLPLLDR